MSYGITYAKAIYRNEHGHRVTTTRVLAENTGAAREAYESELAAIAPADSYVRVDVTLVTDTDDIAKVTDGYWFRPDTMRSFGSRILSGARIIGHKFYFVSSEWTGFDRDRRGYSIRVWDADTDTMDTVGEFNQYDTGAQAKRALARIGKFRVNNRYFDTTDEAREYAGAIFDRTGAIVAIEQA
jgi:hypothetical protein